MTIDELKCVTAPSLDCTGIQESQALCEPLCEDKKKRSISENPDIYEIVGDFGPWQRRIFIFLFFMMVVAAWHVMGVTFLAPKLDFWCISQALQNESYNTSHVQDIDGSLSLRNIDVSVNQRVTNEKCQMKTSDNRSTPCMQWEYDLSIYKRTIRNEWNLVCDKEWVVAFSKSCYMIGQIFSIFTMGQISDWFGRYPVIIFSYFVMTIAATLSAFSTSYVMFLVLRFFMGLGSTGVSRSGFVLLMEIVSPKRRASLGLYFMLGWSIGYVILPGIAWLVKDWFYLQLTFSIAYSLLIFLFWNLTESPRWLLTQGKKNRFEKLIKSAAKKNRHTLDDSVKSHFEEFWENQKTERKSKKKTLVDVFKEPHLRIRLFKLYFIWVVNSFVYYGLSFNTNHLSGNPYWNFFLSGIVEFPAIGIFFYAVRIFGRRKTICIGMVTAGIFHAFIPLVPSNMPWLTVVFSMLAKLSISGTYDTVHIYTTELYPTVVRNVSYGACSTLSRLGAILAPFTQDLKRFTPAFVPDILNATLAVTAGILVLSLPETKHQRMENTIEEGRTNKNKKQEIPINM